MESDKTHFAGFAWNEARDRLPAVAGIRLRAELWQRLAVACEPRLDLILCRLHVYRESTKSTGANHGSVYQYHVVLSNNFKFLGVAGAA